MSGLQDSLLVALDVLQDGSVSDDVTAWAWGQLELFEHAWALPFLSGRRGMSSSRGSSGFYHESMSLTLRGFSYASASGRGYISQAYTSRSKSGRAPRAASVTVGCYGIIY